VTKFGERVSFCWSMAGLAGPYKPPQSGSVILPFIDRLRGYRSALITAAVSGQIHNRQHDKEAT